MKPPLIIPVMLLIIAMIILMPPVPAAISPTESFPAHSVTSIPPVHTEATERATTGTPSAPRPTPGEVFYPMTLRFTPRPTTLLTTVSATRTEFPPGTSFPYVTDTAPEYRSGRVYWPYYDYPRGYQYAYDTTGMLTVTSNPSGAVVILDGYNAETTPFTFTGLSPGYHTVEINYPDYEAYITNVYLDSGQSSEIYADLTPLVLYGSLFVDSTPQGADVYVDGNYQGASPVTVSALSAGAHRIELHLAGYEVLSTTRDVTAGEGTTANLALVPLSSLSDSGSIDITTDLPGALVYLDGIYKGTVQSGAGFSIIAVSPGSHELLLHLPGYQDFLQTVPVYTGQVATVNAAFSRAAQASVPANGTVVVTSVPSGGQVSVDNVFRGVAPVTIFNVAAGTHVINIHLAGYNDWSTSVDVAADQVVQVPATMAAGAGAVSFLQRSAGLPETLVLTALVLGALLMVFRNRR